MEYFTENRGCVYVDLRKLKNNIENVRKKISNSNTKIILVVKANAYSHGAVEIAKYMDGEDYIWGFAVATPSEAFALRRAGIKKEILILSYSFEEDYENIVLNNISSCIFQYNDAVKLSETACKLNKTAKIHIKIDTGMSRIGYADTENSVSEIKAISQLPNLCIEGVFTHFACADEEERDKTLEQLRRFKVFCNRLSEAGIELKMLHCSNSAAALSYPEANMDAVRLGIVIYGMSPSAYLKDKTDDLEPVLSWKSHLVYIKEIKPGTAIGYGGKFIADRNMKIGTVPIGYADGYPRSLSSKGWVLINGKKAKILGNICMDQFMVDLTDINAELLDEVVLVGKSGNEEITIDELGEISGRFNYEFACDIGERILRRYIV